MKTDLLIVDDEPAIIFAYTRYLTKAGYTVSEAQSLRAAREAMAERSFHAVILDMFLPDGNGLQWVPELRQQFPEMAIVIVTGAGDIPLAVNALRQGADNFLTKPVNMDDLDVFLRKGLDVGRLRKSTIAQKRLTSATEPFFGGSAAIADIREFVTLAAGNLSPILLNGETGTGKGVIARWIHEHSAAAEGPCVEVNCSALRGDLLASELFGHTKGAFTSAVADRQGLIEVADGGTLFLDEIGDMDMAVQAQFLKVIEEHTYRRLGETRIRTSRFRLICATNRDLTAAVREGAFRADLFYRINVLPVSMPALRDRVEDIEGFVHYFLHSSTGADPDTKIDPHVMSLLKGYSWPGNVRELKNVLERAVLLARGGPLNMKCFPGIAPVGVSAAVTADTGIASLQDIERGHILNVLNYSNGDIKLTADTLGVSRSTLYRKLKEYGLDR